ncbi:MAG: hypothetical protein CM15mP4_3270 [Candidatus Neomarinimicrobiota bacterium]|nr:MAG: hypothetical protein CM15mP4_3270 [Candidatus Neomarinimicrobiota bacterium]
MLDNTIFGIDCGATKVMAQSAFYDRKSNLVTPGKENLEFNYSDSIIGIHTLPQNQLKPKKGVGLWTN